MNFLIRLIRPIRSIRLIRPIPRSAVFGRAGAARQLLLTSVIGLIGFIGLIGWAAPTARASTLILPPNNTGLVGYWPMNEGQGTITIDKSGNGNTGTATGSPAWVDGKFGKALSFAGDITPDYVSLGNAASLQISNGTLSAWIKTSSAGASYKGIVAKQQAYGVFLKDNILMLYDWGGSGDQTTALNLADGRWHHVVETFQSGVANGTILYSDGVRVLTTSMSLIDQTVEVEIGGANQTNQRFNGIIDDVRIYNRALSAQEISRMYQQGSAKRASLNTTGLVGYWRFNEGIGTKTADASDNGNIGTLLPSPTVGLVQSNNAYNSSPIAYSGSVTAGNLLIYYASQGHGTAPTGVTDSQGNTWTRAFQGSGTPQGGQEINISIWYTFASGTGADTITPTGPNSDYGHAIYEFSGIDPVGTVNAVGALALDSTSSVTHTAGPITNTATSLFFFGYANERDTVQPYTAGTGYTLGRENDGHVDVQQYRTHVAPGTYSNEFLTSNSATDGGGQVVIAFKEKNGPAWTTGKYGAGLSFNGVDDYVSIPHTTAFDFGIRDFSVSAWVKTSGYVDHGSSINVIFSNSDNAPDYIGVSINSSNVVRVDILGTNITSASTINDGQWKHLVVTRVGATTKIYINGVLDNTGSGDAGSVTINNSSYIGKDNLTTRPFNGLIDDVRIYNRALSATEVANLYNDSAAGKMTRINTSSVGISNGLVGWWTFDGPDMTNTTSTDRSGNHNDGTIIGSARPVSGKRGQALNFNGANNSTCTRVQPPNGSQFAFSTFSVSAWINDRGQLYSFNMPVGLDSHYYLNADGSLAYFRVNNGTWVEAGSAFNARNEWHHLGGTFDGVNVKLYIDGQLTSTTAFTGSYSSTTAALTIGSYDSNNGSCGLYNFNGLIDDVRIYNRALSSAEVLQLYNAGK